MTMAIAASLQLSHELGICKRYGTHGYYSHHKRSMVRSVRLNLLSFTLSSHSMSQDFWSFHLSNTIYKPLPLVPSRLNVFMCRSFFIPDKAPETPILKASALALTRLCDAFHEGPVVLKLATAVGIIAFAIWGLGPLMRHARKHFFRNDSNWKRSSTYYILTSYLQPLLLWTGAILICRVLDPVILLSEASQAIKQRLLNFVRSLSTVLAFAYCLSSLIQHAQKFSMETNDSSDTRNMGFQFVGKAVYSAVWVAAVSLFMELLGFSTHKWITAGGLGTVLLTLAGREILTNFLSSVMIHATQPFVVNEWIQTKIDGYEVSGTVEHVGWWSPTILRGDEREAIHVPNHKFTVNVVRNLSQKTHWRINTHLAISHLDANKINNIVADMRKLLAKNSQIEQQRLHRRVFLENINPENQALMILVSCFVKTTHSEEYLCVKEALLLDLLRIVSHHRARLATPIRTVQKVYADADIEDGPFPETIFTRARAATSHPFLLIESPSRINDDKMKAHSTNLSEEHDVNVVAVTGSKEKMSPSPDDSAQNSSDDKQPNKKNLGEAHPNSDKINGTSGTSAAPILPSKPQLEGLDSMGLNSKDITLLGAAFEKPPVSILDSSNESSDPASSAATPTYLKHGAEKLPIAPTSITRPTLEENIVLGVALEGSKRVLPIEEGIAPVPNPTESKELAACQKTNGSNIGKDEKESEMQAVPCAASSDQRDRER